MARFLLKLNQISNLPQKDRIIIKEVEKALDFMATMSPLIKSIIQEIRA